MKSKIVIIILLVLLLNGCETVGVTPGTGSLASLQALQGPRKLVDSHGKSNVGLGHLRYTALKETALSLGARAGLAWRSKQINNILLPEEPKLDETYNFYGLLLNHDILPPVLQEGNNTLALDGPHVIRLASRRYQIVSQARFVTAPPTWRSYLWMDYPKPDTPDQSLLPRTPTEQEIWKQNVAIGWKNGINQGNDIFAANLRRLNRDYRGMVLYLKLYAENMISAPFVAKVNLGITGNGENMTINDHVLRITALPALNLHGNTWRPGLIPADAAEKELARSLNERVKSLSSKQPGQALWSK